MGLDMYLSKRHYVKRWNHMKPAELFDVTVKKGGAPFPSIKPERVSYITEQVMYWRKANQIHHWFVQNVQGGTDDCREYGCDADKLRELLATVERVIADPELASDELPTASGFFFGSTNYDDDYFSDLARTRKELAALLAEEGADHAEYLYQSSW